MPGPKSWDPRARSIKELRVRIPRAMEDASTAFWKEIEKAFPEVRWGDFPPDAESRWMEAVEKTVATWLKMNHPKIELIKEALR